MGAASGDRDRQRIARLTEAIERYIEGGSLACLGAVLAGEKDT